MKLMIDLIELDDLNKQYNKHIDTIYVSDGFVGVKQEASFDKTSLKQIRMKTKELNLRMMVDVNAIYHEEELDIVKSYLIFLKDLGVDSILFSDLAVYMLAKDLHIEDLLVYGSETFVTNNFEVNYWLDRVQSAIISNELSLDELVEIANSAKKPTIYMAYGYHSMFYSKRELLTNYFIYKGKEQKDTINNRKYRIVEEQRTEEYPIVQDERGTHIYTGKIFCLFQELNLFSNTSLNRFHLSANFLNKDDYKKIIELYGLAIDAIHDNRFDLEIKSLFDQVIAVNPNINTSHLYSKSILRKGRE